MGAFFDTMKNLKHSGPAPKICPACGSMKVKQQGSLNGWLIPAVYVCEECGYAGGIVLELEEESDDQKKA
jgi:ssDNA-binding Zn-finger/Zn-ribbon topoisomerase 1